MKRVKTITTTLRPMLLVLLSAAGNVKGSQALNNSASTSSVTTTATTPVTTSQATLTISAEEQAKIKATAQNKSNLTSLIEGIIKKTSEPKATTLGIDCQENLAAHDKWIQSLEKREKIIEDRMEKFRTEHPGARCPSRMLFQIMDTQWRESSRWS